MRRHWRSISFTLLLAALFLAFLHVATGQPGEDAIPDLLGAVVLLGFTVYLTLCLAGMRGAGEGRVVSDGCRRWVDQQGGKR